MFPARQPFFVKGALDDASLETMGACVASLGKCYTELPSRV